MVRIIAIVLTCAALSACQRDERGLVVGKIQKASKLATTEFTIDKVVHGTKTKRLAWFIRLNEARFIAYSKATVKTGIDLKKLSKEDIEIRGTQISLSLPPIEVINFSYPPKDFYLDEHITDNAFLNRITVMDQEEFFRRAEIDIRNNLRYMGIVKTSQDKTRTMLRAMLHALGYTEVYITFQSDELIIAEVPLEQDEL